MLAVYCGYVLPDREKDASEIPHRVTACTENEYLEFGINDGINFCSVVDKKTLSDGGEV